MHPYIFSIGTFHLAAYGVLAALGYLCALIYSRYNARRAGFDLELLWDLFAILIIGALLGGKIVYAALFWHDLGDDFLGRLWATIRDFRNGFVFMGGFAGAVLAGAWYAKRKAFSFWSAADMLAPAIALGHAIGRIGCFMAGCCHGSPANSALSVTFTDPDCLVSARYIGVPLHPTQLYESAGNFALFLALHFMYGRKHKTGAVLAAYCGGYCVLRFCVEFLRGDERGAFMFGLSPSQIACIIVLALCAGFLLRTKNEKA